MVDVDHENLSLVDVGDVGCRPSMLSTLLTVSFTDVFITPGKLTLMTEKKIRKIREIFFYNFQNFELKCLAELLQRN